MTPDPQTFASFDGRLLAYRELGSGHPVILLHGLFSHAEMNWLRFGAAAAVAAAGLRVILPDFRAHGGSAAPHDPAAYPPDVLALDIEALVAHLGGYSLGARTAVRLLARGMRPRRVVLGGMGLSGIVGSEQRAAWFLHVIANRDGFERGTPGWMAAQFMKTNHIDGDAVAHVLHAQLPTPVEVLRTLNVPALVVCGADDRDNGSAPELAKALPNARYVEVAGNHMSAVTMPALGIAIADFLTSPTAPSTAPPTTP